MIRTLDDKIEQNRRTGRALEGLARATFKAWFVDIEPVKAKTAGQTSFPGMPAAAFAALPDRLTDSPLGSVPEGWEVKSLTEVFEINPPRRLSKGVDAPYLDMKNMPTDGHAPDTWERRPHGSGMKFINGDTLVARITPCLENGKTAYVDFLNDDEVAWGSTEYIVLRPKPPLPEIFAYCLARTPEFRDFAIQNMTGTSGRQRVAASAMEHYHITVPTTEIARSFGDVVQPFFQFIRASKDESAKLAALRDYLLPRLLSGKVRVTFLPPTTPTEIASDQVVRETQSSPKKANNQFKEAILIAALVRALASTEHPLGRKRYNKVAYFVHRKSEHDVRQRYLKKAAGPYSPWAKYQGPERIAISKDYVRRGKYQALIAGEKIGAIDAYLPRYDFAPAIEWAVSQFKYRKNDDLELLATVDYAAIELRDQCKPVDAQSVSDLIASEPEWAPKLERAIFSKSNVARALDELLRLFPTE